MVVSDQEIVRRLKETIDFLKVESIGDVGNTPQLIDMLEEYSIRILSVAFIPHRNNIEYW